MERRDFLKTATAASVSAAIPLNAQTSQAATQPTKRPESPNMIYRELGTTGERVSAIGMGGYHLGKQKDSAESIQLIHAGVDRGITFLDNCWDYNDGISEVRMGQALRNGYRQKVFLMTKIDGRTADEYNKQLEQSLGRLQTDMIDLVQFHEVIRMEDPDRIFAPGGAIEAAVAARNAGKIRYIGFTGHKDPAVHLRMLETAQKHSFHFDTVQMPINPFDPSFRSFERSVLPAAVQKGMAVFSIKSMSGSGESIVRGALTPTEALSYAMSVPGVSTTVSGMNSMEVLDQNLEILRNFKPLAENQMAALREHGRQFNDGRYELYKTTVKYESDLGRAQHGFPSFMELPA